MFISGLSGNEIYCLSLKGLRAAEVAVGNSVRSLGVMGSFGSSLQTLAGGEIGNITQLISEGRHAAINRMEEEAKRHGAAGITGVTSELTTLSGYTEFLSQGTSVLSDRQGPLFTTSASGIDLYCHLDAGYRPVRFVMGNVAYALGLGRGITGGFRTMAKGEVKEYSDMYNRIRHLALQRLKEEAAAAGANAVVDIDIDIKPFGPGIVELLMTGTAAHHPRFGEGRVSAREVVTSELTGSELWNMAKLGYAPIELVMATSVYSIGIAGGLGTMFSGLSRGELSELTHMVYEARENCLELVRREAQRLGAEQVIGNGLHIRELSPGLIEIIAIGTAIRRADGMAPEIETLVTQAVITEPDPLKLGGSGMAGVMGSVEMAQAVRQRARPVGCLVAIAMFVLITAISILSALVSAGAHHR